MNQLFFVKLLSNEMEQIVFLFTAESSHAANEKALDRVDPNYRAQYNRSEVTFVCMTPDEVDGFEPV
jgi:hypothetical protein